MKRLFYAFAISFALMACTTTGTISTSTPPSIMVIPTRAASLANALVMATDAESRADKYVNNNMLTRPMLVQLQTRRAAVRSELDKLRLANSSGATLNFTAFQTAYDAFNAGVPK